MDVLVRGTSDGLQIWYFNIIPVLFPFMFCTSLILKTGIANHLLAKLALPFQKIFHCSVQGSLAVMMGFLGGCPMGAKITRQLSQEKKISLEEASFLYGLANNISPAFLTGYVAVSQMKLPTLTFVFLLIPYLSACSYGIIHVRTHKLYFRDSQNRNFITKKTAVFQLIDETISETVWNLLRLAAYIISFSIITQLFLIIFRNNQILLFSGSLLEITKGIHIIASSSLSFPVRFILVNALTSFGGISAMVQSASIADFSGKEFKNYIKSRVIITLLSILYSVLFLLLFNRFHIIWFCRIT